jgi:hypothetical protein
MYFVNIGRYGGTIAATRYNLAITPREPEEPECNIVRDWSLEYLQTQAALKS